MMSDAVRAVILGVVEGVTEFLPVSSTGHMLLVQRFFGFEDEDFGKTFAVLIQFGAILALLLFHMELGVVALIGIILLIGIVKKNAIMMIDFALEAERQHGLSSTEAITEACVMRFRPIMMTTMAAMLGALPLAFGSGGIEKIAFILQPSSEWAAAWIAARMRT